jgi:hypothetical protein
MGINKQGQSKSAYQNNPSRKQGYNQKRGRSERAALLYCDTAILATRPFRCITFPAHYAGAQACVRHWAQGAELAASGFFGLACYMVGVWLYWLTPCRWL